MRCLEREILMEEYEKKVKAYSEAVRRMHEYGAALPLEEFALLYDLAVRASERCQVARQSVLDHVEHHCCETRPPGNGRLWDRQVTEG